MRIRGLVKASNRVRDQLKSGIPSHEVSTFQQYVVKTIQTTDQICAQAHIKPSQLPVPSRNAYKFLKGVNLKRLPIIEFDSRNQGSPQGQMEISIQRIRSQLQYFQDRIADLLPDDTDAENRLIQQLGERTAQIEQLCAAQGATPGNLTQQSQQIYGWMKFLQSDDHLHLHAYAVRQTKAIAEQTLANQSSARSARPFKELKHLRLEFTPMSALYRCQFKPPQLKIRINEGFILAEPDVMQAVIDSMLLGKTPKTSTIMTEYSLSEEFSELLLALDLMVDDLRDMAQGNVYNLDDVFAQVNQAYFNQEVKKPRLCWSKVYSNRKFGHYEPSRDRVVMSLSLDSDQLPNYVIEFVMYHELLHKIHGGRTQNGRRWVHTPEFRRDERQFKYYSQAQQHLEQLARKL
ncbi:M48 family peptidase [Acaryochloris marina]|uniref:M48 family peptidase n=1 Tax=Acaryochloris marina TaxID=155978 RepID=UPI001BAEC245|nr:M48 family peptidase [Acaryochloris marina]QUY44143.1 M48 family peptidase [Acaryochloris marina S15]